MIATGQPLGGDTTFSAAGLARTLREVSWPDLPLSVRAQVRRLIVDVTGCIIAGTRCASYRTALSFARATFRPGAASVVGSQERMNVLGAAFVNGVAANALDLDDGYRLAKGHPGAGVLPAVVATAEEVGATGEQVAMALVLAYETALRCALRVHAEYGYYHGSGAWCAVGAAAGCGYLRGLPDDQFASALGIAEYQAPIAPEIRGVNMPTMTKDGVGWGAMTGAAATELAAAGHTGIKSLVDDTVPGSAFDGVTYLRTAALLPGTYLKLFACCRWAQPAIAAVLKTVDEHGIARHEIERITVQTFSEACHLTTKTPTSTEEAQYSLPWPVAAALTFGSVGPEEVSNEALHDTRAREMARRVEMEVSEELDASFPEKTLARVAIETTDGTVHRSGVTSCPGDADTDPLTDDQVTEKFRALVAGHLHEDTRPDALTRAWTLPELPDLQPFTAVLRQVVAWPDRLAGEAR